MKDEITFETGVLAKKKGFNWNTDGYFNGDGDVYYASYYDPTPNNKTIEGEWFSGGNEGLCTAPTQSVLQKWLREKHNIHVNPISNFTTRFGDYNLEIIFINKNIIDSIVFREPEKLKSFFDSYEEALEKGLQEALKLIK